jgi:hypothetical protein
LQKSISSKIYSRQVYGVLDAFGDVGGLNDAIHLSLALLIGALIEKTFKVDVVKNKFKYVPSDKPRLRTVEQPEDGIIRDEDVEKLMHATASKSIKSSCEKLMRLFFLPLSCRKQSKFEKLINKGMKRIDGSIDIANLLKLT